MVRISYNQGPQLAHWWFDRYLDFDDAQAADARAALQRWFDWHRATQLGPYAEALAQLRREAAQPVTPAQACRWFDQIADHIRTGARQAMPAMAELALRLTPAQLDHLERRQQRNIAEMREEHLQPDLDERRRAHFDRTLDRVETFYGSLDDAQREMLQRALAASPFDAGRWLAERVERQRDTMATLRRLQSQRATPAAAEEALAALFEQVLRSPRAAYRDYQRGLIDFNCALAARIHNQATPEQRRHLLEKLQGWEDDLRALGAP